MKDFTDFHYLIEIVVNLRKSSVNERNNSNQDTKRLKTFWETKADHWIKENYRFNGIKSSINKSI